MGSSPGSFGVKPWLLGLFGALLSCSDNPSGVMLAVSTNLLLPEEADTLEIVVERGGQEIFRQNYPLIRGVLPATLMFRDRDNQELNAQVFYKIQIRKEGQQRGVIERTAVLGFVKEKVKLLRMPLRRACLDVRCEPGSTCDQGKCVDNRVDAQSLPDFTSNEEVLLQEGAAGDGGGGAGQGGAGQGGGGQGGGGQGGGGQGGGGQGGAGQGGAGPGGAGQGGVAGDGGTGGVAGDGGNGAAGDGGGGAAGEAPVVCGDGLVHETEGCDDENTAPGDGCSEQCTVESGFTCEGAPSVCADVDECMEDLDNCDPNALCTNTAGGFTCACKEGYFGDGLLCTLIECADGDVGQAAPGPSCDGLAPTCGAAHDESCCTSQIVPGNAVGGACEGQPFFLDYDAAAGNYDTKNAPATVSNYAIDKFEVTVGRFRKFVEAYDQWHVVEKHPLPGEGAHPRVTNAPTAWDPAWDEAVCPGDTGKKPCLPIDAADFRSATRINPVQNNKQNTWTNEPDIHENRPINYVNWFEAYAFCLWDGGWLPTSSEWMYAAAGGTQQRSYPWSVPPTSTTINGTYASYTQNSTYTGCGKPSNAFVIGCIIEVGTKPLGVGRWLHMDMGGNLSEWNVDWYKPTYTTPCDNCVQSVVGTQRAHRGSDIYDGPALLRVPRQNFNEPYKRGIDIGFRCARLP